MNSMKLKENGKEHQVANSRCPSCDQTAPDGERLVPRNARFPYPDASGNPPCGGFVHSEIFGDLRTGLEILYRCDKCGSFF